MKLNKEETKILEICFLFELYIDGSDYEIQEYARTNFIKQMIDFEIMINQLTR